MSEIKLLNCPFCGGEAEFHRTPIKSKGGWCDSIVVRCKECEARTNRVLYNAEKHKNDSEYEESAKAWNTRKPMQEIVERLEDAKVCIVDDYTEEYEDMVFLEEAIEIVKEVGGMDEYRRTSKSKL